MFAAWAPKGGLAQLPERAAFGIAGALSGTLGVVIGATGPIIAPFLLREGWENEEIIATKATGQAFIHAQKIVAFGVAGYVLDDMVWQLPPLIAAVIVGTYTGKWLLQYLSKDRFRLVYRGAKRRGGPADDDLGLSIDSCPRRDTRASMAYDNAICEV